MTWRQRKSLAEAGVDGVVAAGFGGGAEVEEERLEADTRCYEP